MSGAGGGGTRAEEAQEEKKKKPAGAGAGAAPPPGGGSGGPSADALRSAAAAALAAARDAASVTGAGKTTVTETRRFAGKEITVTRAVDKEAAAGKGKGGGRGGAPGPSPPGPPSAPSAPASGLDAVLAELEAKKRINVVDKSALDWQDAKRKSQALEAELAAHGRSGTQYLERQEFLSRAELREYEQERDRRLAGGDGGGGRSRGGR